MGLPLCFYANVLNLTRNLFRWTIGREKFCSQSPCRHLICRQCHENDWYVYIISKLHLLTRLLFSRGCLDVCDTYSWCSDCSARLWRFVHPTSIVFPANHWCLQSGVHSIERSAQEDTLLVLFNTAISNLVCQLDYSFVTWAYVHLKGFIPE